MYEYRVSAGRYYFHGQNVPSTEITGKIHDGLKGLNYNVKNIIMGETGSGERFTVTIVIGAYNRHLSLTNILKEVEDLLYVPGKLVTTGVSMFEFETLVNFAWDISHLKDHWLEHGTNLQDYMA